ncbi:MAG: ABC-2 family transporter protein [Deltaproteobacteria bacterium]|nr:ABC-2 family transporter protein [Deltaproteobacteria bacterium]
MRAGWRAWPGLWRAGIASAVAYRAEFVIWMLTTNMPLVMLALWSAVARSGPVAGYSSADFTAYYLTSLMVRVLTGCWVVWEMSMEIRSGTLSLRLLRPLHPFVAYAAENLAAFPLRALVATPILVLLVVFAHDKLTHDWLAWALFLPMLLGAWLITFLVMAIVGTLALFMESAIGLFQLWLSVSFVLSGYLIPLDLFPPALRQLTAVLPFRFTVSLPIELVLGRLSHAHALELMAAQWAYVAGFGVVALWLWRRGLSRFGAFGG